MNSTSVFTKDLPCVLFVDDNPDSLNIIKMTFRNFFHLEFACDVDEGLKKIKLFPYDAVITDFEMPVGNGLDLLKTVKVHYPDLPVIFYTGQGSEEVAREAFILGASDYFVKDVRGFAHKEKLINSILRAIEKRKLEQAARETDEYYRAIVAAFDGFIYICSQDYKVEFMNGKFIERTGYDGTGEYCYKALHDFSDICPWCVNDRVFSGEKVEWEVLSPKDNRWYHIINTPIHHNNGTISKMAMIRDITQYKKIELDLCNSQQQLEIMRKRIPCVF